jgi:hypothetical protein
MTEQSRRNLARLAAELRVRQRRYREEFAALENAKQVILRSVKSRSRAFDPSHRAPGSAPHHDARAETDAAIEA